MIIKAKMITTDDKKIKTTAGNEFKPQVQTHTLNQIKINITAGGKRVYGN